MTRFEQVTKNLDNLYLIISFFQSAESRSQRTVSLTKGSEGLGMSIVGTATTGVFVSMLVSGGYAERDGRLKKGDQILSINGITMGTIDTLYLIIFDEIVFL